MTYLTDRQDEILKHLTLSVLCDEKEVYAELRDWLTGDKQRFIRFAHFMQEVSAEFLLAVIRDKALAMTGEVGPCNHHN